jgi:drug/metabolite transporter (DMT)-like permease
VSGAFALRDGLLLGLLAFMWGNSFLFIKLALAAVPPVWLVALRLCIGALLLAVVIVVRREAVRGALALWPVIAFVGLVGAALPWIGQAWASKFLDSGLVAVLNSSTPVVTLTLAVLVGQERLFRNRVLGLGTAIVGTLIVVGGEIGAGRSALALVVAVLATTGYAVGAVVARARLAGRVTPLASSAIQLGCSALVISAAASLTSGAFPYRDLDAVVTGSLLALGVFGTGLGFLIYFTLIERVGATSASMVTYLVPVVGLISGALVRGERFGGNVLLGAAVLIAGVWLAQRRPRPLKA